MELICKDPTRTLIKGKVYDGKLLCRFKVGKDIETNIVNDFDDASHFMIRFTNIPRTIIVKISRFTTLEKASEELKITKSRLLAFKAAVERLKKQAVQKKIFRLIFKFNNKYFLLCTPTVNYSYWHEPKEITKLSTY